MHHEHHHHDESHHGHHQGHHDHHHGGQGGHHHGHGHHHGRSRQEGHEAGHTRTSRGREGDVLTCGCQDCNVELTVTKACQGDVCGTGCDVDVRCCGEPMQVRTA